LSKTILNHFRLLHLKHLYDTKTELKQLPYDENRECNILLGFNTEEWNIVGTCSHYSIHFIRRDWLLWHGWLRKVHLKCLSCSLHVILNTASDAKQTLSFPSSNPI